MTQKQKLILLLIVFVAIFFRFYLIAQMPGGLFPDEAANGLDINLMQQGHLQPFYERGNGREALFFYMLWGSVDLLGKGPWQHHIVSALIGVLAVIVCFLVARKIFSLGLDPEDEKGKSRAVNIALLAAFLMAVNSWHVVLSRTAFRAILIPLFAGLTFYFLICTYQALTKKKQLLYAFLTGASFALGFYTYIAFRIMAPALFAVLLWPLLGAIKQAQFKAVIKKCFWHAIFFLLAFVIFIFPIGKYFYTHSGSFIGRAGQVSVFNPELYTIGGVQLHGKPPVVSVLKVMIEVTKTQLFGFFTNGDLNWRQNVSGLPFLSPLVSPFFAIGLIFVTLLAVLYFFMPASASKYWKYFLLAVWFWGMLLPVVSTAEGIPHGLRGIGAIPEVFIISAWVLYEFGAKVYKYHLRVWQNWMQPAWRFAVADFSLRSIVVVFVFALILQSYFYYFVYAYNSPENFYYFRSDLTQVSEYLKENCNKQHTYLVLDKFSVQTTDYLTSDWKGNFSSPCNVPYTQVDPEDSWKLRALQSGDQIVFTQSSIFDTKKFKQYHPEASLAVEYRNKFGQAIMAVYKVY